MEEPSVELRERLALLNTDLLLDRLWPADAVWLACDLLVAGFDSPVLVELAGESPGGLGLVDAEPLVRQLLVEFGFETVEPGQGVWYFVRAIARQLLAGTLPLATAEWELLQLRDLHDGLDELWPMLHQLDLCSELLPAERDDEAVIAELRQFAHDVVRVADARIAALP